MAMVIAATGYGNSAMKRCTRGGRGSVAASGIFCCCCCCCAFVALFELVVSVPSTLDGPFAPRTMKFDASLRTGSQDMDPTNPRVAKAVKGNEPDQIALALSTPDAMWVTWTTGE